MACVSLEHIRHRSFLLCNSTQNGIAYALSVSNRLLITPLLRYSQVLLDITKFLSELEFDGKSPLSTRP